MTGGLGDARPSFTLDIYGHMIPTMQNEVANLMDDLAMAFINGLAGLRWGSFKEIRGEGISIVIPAKDILDDLSF
jgi:hypothetical protein